MPKNTQNDTPTTSVGEQKIIHAVAGYSYDPLLTVLERLVIERRVNKRTSPDGYYTLYNYASIVSTKWGDEPIMTIARGFVIDSIKKKIVALPFPKFFNHNEHPPTGGYDDHEILSVETKHDGSLGIMFYDEYNDNWRMITRGSFTSPQAKWGMEHLLRVSGANISILDKTNTYLFEIICPESKVVVLYDTDQLRLLSAYNNITFEEVSRSILENIAGLIGCPIVERHDDLNTIPKIMEKLSGMSGFSQEGYVVMLRSPDGTVDRRKFKCDNYKKIHCSKSDLSEKRIWEIMKSSEHPMKTIREFSDSQPEEHFELVMGWANEIMSKYNNLVESLEHDVRMTASMDARTLGITIKSPGDFTFKLPKKCLPLLFAQRKESNVAKKLWNHCL